MKTNISYIALIAALTSFIADNAYSMDEEEQEQIAPRGVVQEETAKLPTENERGNCSSHHQRKQSSPKKCNVSQRKRAPFPDIQEGTAPFSDPAFKLFMAHNAYPVGEEEQEKIAQHGAVKRRNGNTGMSSNEKRPRKQQRFETTEQSSEIIAETIKSEGGLDSLKLAPIAMNFEDAEQLEIESSPCAQTSSKQKQQNRKRPRANKDSNGKETSALSATQQSLPHLAELNLLPVHISHTYLQPIRTTLHMLLQQERSLLQPQTLN